MIVFFSLFLPLVGGNERGPPIVIEGQDEVDEVVEPACDLLAVLRGAVAPAEEDYIETPIDTGELILSLQTRVNLNGEP